MLLLLFSRRGAVPGANRFPPSSLPPHRVAHSYECAEIRRREAAHLRLLLSAWRAEPGMVVLGSPTADRLSIVSFMVPFPGTHRFLHFNFVAALLNDLFGIQCRGG